MWEVIIAILCGFGVGCAIKIAYYYLKTLLKGENHAR